MRGENCKDASDSAMINTEKTTATVVIIEPAMVAKISCEAATSSWRIQAARDASAVSSGMARSANTMPTASSA
jgi:hypothetical protein